MDDVIERHYPRLSDILVKLRSPFRADTYETVGEPTRIGGAGFLFELHTTTARDKDSGEDRHMIVKVVPKEYPLVEHTYRNEVYFYNVIFPELNSFQKKKMVRTPFLAVPRYMGGHIDNERKVLAIENLNSVGYRYSATRSSNSSDIIAIFRMFAKFHALSTCYCRQNPVRFEEMRGELVDILKFFPVVKSRIENSYRFALDQLREHNELSEREWVRLDKLDDVQKIIDEAKEYDGPYKCFVMGDARSANMLFKHSESGDLQDVKLLDFSAIHSNSPVYDLALFFYGEAPCADLDKLDEYLEIYHESFSRFVRELGNDPLEIYSLSALKDEWKKYCLFGLIQGISLWVDVMKQIDSLMRLMDADNWPKEKFLELWNARKIEVMKRDSSRERSKEIIRHSIDYGII